MIALAALCAALVIAGVVDLALALARTADQLFPDLDAERAGVFYTGAQSGQQHPHQPPEPRHVDLFGDSSVVVDEDVARRMREGWGLGHFGSMK